MFNVDGTKNREVTRMASLGIRINGHKEQLEAAVTDLNGMNMFLGHDWLCYDWYLKNEAWRWVQGITL